jgi:hypothetical protein
MNITCPDGTLTATVTDRLKLEASKSFERGDLVSPSRSDKRRTRSIWILRSSESPEDDVELGESLNKLLDLVEPVAAELHQLAAEGYAVAWPCLLASHTAEHMATVSHSTLARLAVLPGDLLIDVQDGSVDDAGS